MLLNSIYGTFANKHSSLMDIDNASSITLTGQEVAKAGATILDNAIREQYKIDPEYVVVAQDTDSVMITIQPALDALNAPFFEDENAKTISKTTYDIVNFLDGVVNTKILEWAKKELNANDPRYIFKREAIADVGMYLAKKRYVLHILDNEGVLEEKFKYVGIELVRSTLPAAAKKLVKEITDIAVLTQDRKATNEAYLASWEKFKTIDPCEIAIRMTANGMEKYFSPTVTLRKFATKTPRHIKAAIAYNLLRKQLKLEGTFEEIIAGQKIRLFDVADNPYGIEAIAYSDELPQEFDLKPDYESMFKKLIRAPIERIYTMAGWPMPSAFEQHQTDLFDLLGI